MVVYLELRNKEVNMSLRYDMYIEEHKKNVFEAFKWLLEHNILEGYEEEIISSARYLCEYAHDQSKTNSDEYDAYDAYFYGTNKSYEVVQNFNKAWLTHIHKNAHHWQHWILIQDDPENGEIILDMPDQYIIEMVCDWMSFSIKKGDIKEIFNWYAEHRDYMKLSVDTRFKVEHILYQINAKLAEESNVTNG